MPEIPTLYMAEEIIEDTINRFEKVVIACSFGKDSMVISDLARKINPDIPHVFYKTGVQFPEHIKYMNKMVELYNINLVVLTSYKGITFWDCVKKYGLPKMRARGKGRRHSPRCCYYLKEKPMNNYIKENKIEAVITGMTSAESWNRYQLARRYSKSDVVKNGLHYCSQRYYAKTWRSWQVHPLMSWIEKDVFNYLKTNNIPLNPIYTLWGGIHKRCGCLPCTAYLDWERNLRVSHPKLYRFLKNIELEQKNQKILEECFDSRARNKLSARP